jgi:hypothetical protein
MQPCASAGASRSGSARQRSPPGTPSGAARAAASRATLPWRSQTALTLRAVFPLALRQTEGLIGSIIRLLALELAMPDHSTLSRRAETL